MMDNGIGMDMVSLAQVVVTTASLVTRHGDGVIMASQRRTNKNETQRMVCDNGLAANHFTPVTP